MLEQSEPLRWERIHLQGSRSRFNPWVGKTPGDGNGNPLQTTGKFHGQRSFLGFCCQELDTTEQLTHTQTQQLKKQTESFCFKRMRHEFIKIYNK